MDDYDGGWLILLRGRTKSCKISLEYGQKLHQKCDFFYKFSECLEEKDQNVHLSDKFPLKIANISLEKRRLPQHIHLLTFFCFFVLRWLNMHLVYLLDQC